MEVRYIVADRRWVFERLNERENIFINYLMGILVRPIAKQLSAKKEPLHILFDNRSIKVGALFCMEDYLKTKIYGDWRCNIDFRCSIWNPAIVTQFKGGLIMLQMLFGFTMRGGTKNVYIKG